LNTEETEGAELHRGGIEVAQSRPVFNPDRLEIPESWNRVTEMVIGAAMEVHSALGPGLLERLYEDALCHELTLRNVQFQRQYPIHLKYKGVGLSAQRVDLVVENLVVVELKSIEAVHDIQLAQMLSYMRSAQLPLAAAARIAALHADSLSESQRTVSPPTPHSV
jgi:GxxExxY protein